MTAIGFFLLCVSAVLLASSEKNVNDYIANLTNRGAALFFVGLLGSFCIIAGVTLKLWSVMP